MRFNSFVEMQKFSSPCLHVLGIISIYVINDIVKDLAVFNVTLIPDRLISLAEIICLHTDVFQKGLSDMSAVNTAKYFSQLFESAVRIDKIADRLSNPYFI